MRIIVAIIFALIGFYCIDYNMTHDAKHNILLGIVGYTFSVLLPLTIIFI